MSPTRIKICCIAGREEAQLAIAAGAAAVGLVSAMPSGPGVISEERIAAITADLPPAIGSFLLTSKVSVGEIIAQQRRCGANTLQLVDRLVGGAHAELRAALPGVAIVQVVHITGPEALDEALLVAPQVHGLLLDSGNPNLPIKELGGTGRTHNWEISREIVQRCGRPVFLAGGLDASNVGAAIRMVRPYGVDICSGVRTAGALDRAKLAAFVAAVRQADL